MNCGHPTFVASLVFWSIMMGIFLKEHAVRPAAEVGNMMLGVVRDIPGASAWYSIFRAERKIGYANVAVSADAAHGAVDYRIDLYSRLLLMGGSSILGEMHLRAPGGMAAFSFQMRAGKDIVSVSGRPQGEHRMVVEYDLRDCRDVLANVMPAAALSPEGRVNLDLRSLNEEPMRLRSIGDEIVRTGGALVPARRYMLSSGAVEATVWLDNQGGLVRADLPGKIGLVRESRILAERL